MRARGNWYSLFFLFFFISSQQQLYKQFNELNVLTFLELDLQCHPMHLETENRMVLNVK